MALLASSACVAQDHQRGDMTERMKTELGLSDEQVAQLKEVYSQMRPSQQGERPSREEMQKKREEADAKVKKILTEEQYAKYEKMRKERRPQRPQGNDGQEKQ